MKLEKNVRIAALILGIALVALEVVMLSFLGQPGITLASSATDVSTMLFDLDAMTTPLKLRSMMLGRCEHDDSVIWDLVL
ncbi:MAG: hypothetical protein AB8F65_11740 [Woeseiaceae bacterium]